MLCLGPVCVPVWQVGVIFALLLGPFRATAAYLYETCCRRRRCTEVNGGPLPSNSLLLHRGAGGCPVYEDLKRRVTQREFQILHIRSDEEMKKFWKEVHKAPDTTVFADFSAQWCGPCRAISPFYELLSAGYEGIFISIDIDDCPYTAEAARVSVLPTLGLLECTAAGAAHPWELVASTSGASARQWEEFVARYTVPRSSSTSSSLTLPKGRKTGALQNR